MATKWIFYLRVSTQGQARSGLGADSQLAVLEHFIPENQRYGEVFRDDAISGTVKPEDRPAFRRALSIMDHDTSVGLAVAKLDRLSRMTVDVLNTTTTLGPNRFFAADVPGKPGDPQDTVVMTMMAAIAQRERELTAIRTRLALQAKKQRLAGEGRKLGRPGATFSVTQRYNSHASRRANFFEANKDAARYIVRQRSLEAGPLSYRAIAVRLNAMCGERAGLNDRGQMLRRVREGNGVRQWDRASVSRLYHCAVKVEAAEAAAAAQAAAGVAAAAAPAAAGVAAAEADDSSVGDSEDFHGNIEAE